MTSPAPIAVDDILAAAPARVSDDQAAALAARLYGLDCSARLLAGERDLNFHLTCDDGRQLLLKVSNPAEDPNVADFQNRALRHIQACDPDLPVQRILASSQGALQTAVSVDGQQVLVRLFSFVEGVVLCHVAEPGEAFRQGLGTHLARLGLALRGFFHPAAGHELLWDLKHAQRLTAMTGLIGDSETRELVRRFLGHFERFALPRLPSLRAQVIHNDLNLHNVIVDAQPPHELRNILDFGDMVHAPLINDLAVGAAYQLGATGNPLERALPFIAAYHRVCPLEPREQEILFDLIATRLVLTLVITNWRASLYPRNRAYILRNAPSALSALQGFAQLSREDAQDQIRQACQQETR
ncbi:phosphotransferase [Pseudomonas asplenii]|uniref:phosphotransferase n=1 Tax=Pseudomonas asplenii TaxID=53407 RepID=UPI0003600571|nr:phosphotransferase [Pseudomonas fuscovaginae]